MMTCSFVGNCPLAAWWDSKKGAFLGRGNSLSKDSNAEMCLEGLKTERRPRWYIIIRRER